jgi:hypothetical protein
MLLALAISGCGSDGVPASSPSAAGQAEPKPVQPGIVQLSPLPEIPEDASAPSAATRLRAYRLRTRAKAPEAQPAAPSTPFGQKLGELRADHARLRQTIADHDKTYRTIRGAIERHSTSYAALSTQLAAKLEAGTAPQDPLITGDIHRGRAEIERIGAEISALKGLAALAVNDAAMAAKLHEAASEASRLSGGTEAEEGARATLEEEIRRSATSLDLMVNGIAFDVESLEAFTAAERATFALLAQGREAIPSPPPISPTPAQTMASALQPLIVIRFDRPNVAYKQPLYQAVKTALERRPNAVFDLVVVSASGGDADAASANLAAANRHAGMVLATLDQMGLPLERVVLSGHSSPDIANNEIRLFVR